MKNTGKYISNKQTSILFLFVILIIASFFLARSKSESVVNRGCGTNEKLYTYSKNSYNFSFCEPESWQVDASENKNTNYATLRLKNNNIKADKSRDTIILQTGNVEYFNNAKEQATLDEYKELVSVRGEHLTELKKVIVKNDDKNFAYIERDYDTGGNLLTSFSWYKKGSNNEVGASYYFNMMYEENSDPVQVLEKSEAFNRIIETFKEY